MVRSEQPSLSLPAGRYVLVVKGVGYDFTVDGTVTNSAHCLERTEALDAPIYSEVPEAIGTLWPPNPSYPATSDALSDNG